MTRYNFFLAGAQYETIHTSLVALQSKLRALMNLALSDDDRTALHTAYAQSVAVVDTVNTMAARQKFDDDASLADISQAIGVVKLIRSLMRGAQAQSNG